jgi:cytochrome b
MATRPVIRPATRAVRVWDLPVRLVHWSLVVLVPAMWITAENDAMAWHIRLGHALLALLVFRLVWGLIGTDTARFASFVKGPGRVLAYLRGNYDARAEKGHSPLGALAVLGLLGVLAVQIGLGLFAGDPFDGATGPLNSLVGALTAETITELHEAFFYAVLAMVGLHLGAIGVYGAFRAQNLIGAMVTGKDDKTHAVVDNSPASWSRALIALAAALAVTGWVWSGAPPLS